MTQPAEPPRATNGLVLQALQRVADAALAHLSEDDLLRELLLRITEILRHRHGRDPAARRRRRRAARTAAKGIEEEVEQGVEIPVGKGFAGRIAAERRAIAIEDVDHADILNPILREKGIRSLLGVPLLVEGRAARRPARRQPRAPQLHRGEADLLQLAADRAALAIEHAELFERATARRRGPGSRRSRRFSGWRTRRSPTSQRSSC